MTVLISGDSFLDEGLVSNYNMVKDFSWPVIETSSELLVLPEWIKNECVNDHNMALNSSKCKTLESKFGEGIINMARSGAGNEYIAHSIIETCTTHTSIDYVFVLWSGISRIDVSFGNSVVNTINDNLNHCTSLNDRNWIHCGGLLGSHLELGKKNILKQYIKTQHFESDLKYLTNITLYNILITQAFLENRDIKYDFGWIYNPHIQYDLDDNIEISNELILDKTSPLYNNIEWDKFLPTYPYNWCKERVLLEDDGFHPTDKGLSQWFENLTLKGS